MELRAPKKIALPAVRANLGVAADYTRRLDKMIDTMDKSITYWVTATWPCCSGPAR